MGEFEVVTTTLQQEHHALSVVVAAMQRMLHDIHARRGEPDFGLFAAALYYIDDFPGRCHHPKEDEFLFATLRRRTSRHDAVLDELQAEHVRSEQLVAYLHRALVHYQGGAPGGLRLFRDAVDAYANLLGDHMRKEERLLEDMQAHLNDADWSAIAVAFESNDDPLFGKSRRSEFDRLFHRIQNRLPRKLKKPARDGRES